MSLRHGSRPRVALLAPQGWGLRDWVFSGFLEALTRSADAVVFTPRAAELRDVHPRTGVRYEEMAVEPLGPLARMVDQAVARGHFHRVGSYIHRTLLARRPRDAGAVTRLRHALVRLAGAGLFRWMPFRWQETVERAALGLMKESRRLEGILRREGVDLLFSTAPLIAHFELPALWAAGRLGIPRTTFISSWDNLYSKGRLPVEFDRFLVWSRRMETDLRDQYPTIREERTRVVGAPQFDYYFREGFVEEREVFLRSIGADPERPLVLWSGVSPGQLGDEPEILGLFCERLRNGEVRGNPQLLVRPHPIGGGARFRTVQERFPEVLFTETNDVDPRYLVGWVPHVESQRLLVNSVAHAALNVNHCSTMTLDACVMDRPVINVAFGSRPGSPEERATRACYRYDHYRSVMEIGAVGKAESLEELVTIANRYLEDPERDRAARRELVELQCGPVDGGAAARAAGSILEQLGAGAPVSGVPVR